MKAVIAGGGIIGLSIALELRSGGADVTVFDAPPPGTRASNAAGGMLAPQKEAHAPGPFLDACLMSRTIWPRFAAQVAEASGQPSTYRESGILTAAFTDDELHALDATAAWQKACHLRVEQLTGDEARQLEPSLSPSVVGAAFFPDEHQVDPVAFMPALQAACRAKGVTLVDARADAIVSESGRAVGLRHAGGVASADEVIVAAGAWSGLLEGMPPGLVTPIRGQMIALAGEGLPERILGGPRCYLIPRGGGRAVAGTTEEKAGFECLTTPNAIARIRDAVDELCPGARGARITREWAGLRPWASSDLPIISPGPLQNLHLAIGHYRNGILLAPLTARLLCQMILGQRTSVDPKPFRYDRLPS